MLRQGKRYVSPGQLTRLWQRRLKAQGYSLAPPCERTIARWCAEVVSYQQMAIDPPERAVLRDVYRPKWSNRYYVAVAELDRLLAE